MPRRSGAHHHHHPHQDRARAWARAAFHHQTHLPSQAPVHLRHLCQYQCTHGTATPLQAPSQGHHTHRRVLLTLQRPCVMAAAPRTAATRPHQVMGIPLKRRKHPPLPMSQQATWRKPLPRKEQHSAVTNCSLAWRWAPRVTPRNAPPPLGMLKLRQSRSLPHPAPRQPTRRPWSHCWRST